MNLTSKIISIMLLTACVWGSALARLCSAQQPSFSVQVMSISDKDGAARFVDELMNQGFEASVVELKEKEKPAYKVRVGNCTNRKAAELLYEKLRMKGIEGWIVQVLEQPAPQAHVAEKTGPAPAQQPDPQNVASGKPFEPGILPAAAFAEDNKTAASLKTEPAQPAQPAAVQPDSEHAAPVKPFELVINPVATFAEDNKTAPPPKTAPLPDLAQPPKPAAAQQPDSEHVAPVKPFELVVNPVATFAAEEKQTAPPPEMAPVRALQPAKTYKYFNPGDDTIHITSDIEKIPVPLRRHIWEIAIFPIYYKSLDLHDMSMNTAIEGKTVNVVLEGINRPERAPPTQEVRSFEAALQANPLRIKYYPARTDPDGALHGVLFFTDGASVEMDMIRRRLATCAAGELSSFQQSACTEAQQ